MTDKQFTVQDMIFELEKLPNREAIVLCPYWSFPTGVVGLQYLSHEDLSEGGYPENAEEWPEGVVRLF